MAKDAGKMDIFELLEQERLTAPAQIVHTNSSLEITLWIGEEVSTVGV